MDSLPAWRRARIADSNSRPLFEPFALGPFHLSHRVVLAPMTRCRALNCVPQKAHEIYYGERATAGGLLITEASAVAPEGIGFPHSPGIWSEEQIEAWRKVVEAVHAKGGIIFCQLWHVGRASHTCHQPNGAPPVSSTDKRLAEQYQARIYDSKFDRFSQPRALTTDEIPKIVDQYRQAARNAISAGFDGVEIHAAHGYLIDQFFKDGINDRTDMYGGSLENRCRFGLQVFDAVIKEIGAERVGIRISPVIDHLDALDSDPLSLGMYLVSKLNAISFLYLHMTEPRSSSKGVIEKETRNLSVFRQAFKGQFLCSGGYTRQTAADAIRNGYADLIAFGRDFISNPDLPLRFYLNKELNPYDRSTFYTHDQRLGFVDYPSLS